MAEQNPVPFFDEDAPLLKEGGIAARALAASGRGGVADYLSGLNPEQRDAVETLDGPLLVLAGAGTGKTRVLTTRIAHILASRRAHPSEILAVTFTNKAAREMKMRVANLVGDVAEGMPWLGTFHSIGTRILRRHAELAGLKSSFTILDTDDQIRLIKQILQAENIDEKRWPARSLAWTIDGWKNRGLGPAEIPAGEGASFANGKGGKLYTLYQERLKTLNAADFGDLLLEPIRIFRAHPDVLAIYHHRFRFLLVDEYQDTNVAQYLWLRLLAQGPQNLCCVGDDDQSIYGWRGAEVDNILRFDKDFPGAKVIRLERNYRSDAHILGAASHLIAHNEGRLGKTLRPQGADGEPVTVTGSWDSGEEARSIGDEIESLERKGESLDSMAILMRASFQMREFEERFVTLGLNYRVIGGPRFYERAEIRDALAYLRCVNSPFDGLAFERIVNTPKRGLGDATIQTLNHIARSANVPLMEAARMASDSEELKPKPRQTLRDLTGCFQRWSRQAETMKHTDLAEMVLDESGYTEMWRQDRSPDAAGRLENLKELIRSMDGFENLQGFLEHVSLVMDVEGPNNGAAVTLMTLHGAKGLEFDTVFLPGWEEGLFPSQRSMDENGRAGLEEERRLAYVGITRARKRAKIYFASNRRIHGMWQSSIPSRFLDELPDAHVEVKEAPAAFSNRGYGTSRFDRVEPFGSTYNTPGWQRAQARRETHAGFAEPKRSGLSSGPGRRGGPMVIEGELVATSDASAATYRTGERVFHDKFGYGDVIGVEGNKLTVQFDKAGQKRVIDSFVKRA
ncbi:ATP-dependent helicase [Terrihabitans rhizophilus]|uniref:DNA 3'-5' helicase n=1 Tax=Terrihabitans rhizophilus TaxID=3092662 RepID=A0ABU4RMZ9_9HYPH|nr:UvrD-helicase domain-containing protein [Terrihabitans sp. PJ23]MDX6805578.1 UvrD-helicase domain-containing protein [Terrihabitans sp. PJ23]